MVRETMKVDATEFALTDGKRFRSFRRLQHESSQLALEFICKLWTGDMVVIVHNRKDIGLDFGMQDKPHQTRRPAICWSSCSSEVPKSGSVWNSASRSNASAIPSSSSSRIAGSDRSRCAARTARCASGRSNASFSTSVIVTISKKVAICDFRASAASSTYLLRLQT
jgi:hypothetical protein